MRVNAANGKQHQASIYPRHLYIGNELFSNALDDGSRATGKPIKDKVLKTHHQKGYVFPVRYRTSSTMFDDKTFPSADRFGFKVMMRGDLLVPDFGGGSDIQDYQHIGIHQRAS